MKWRLPFLLLFSVNAYAQGFTETESQCVEQLEALIKRNQELVIKAKELEALQKAYPELELEPLQIIIDKDGRTFVTDKLTGKLKIGDLSYDVVIKLKTTVVMTKKKQYGFGLQFKAAAIQSYELNDEDNLETFTSGALAIEPFYYRDFNVNLIIGPRLYGPAIGVDITEHFGGLAGVGFKYNDEKAFFLGAAFDF